MKWLKSLQLIFSVQTLIITVLAVISTAICRHYDLTAGFPLALIAAAIVFPIVFSIGGAYKRRESALREYGSLKAHGRAIYFATRDWLGEPHPELLTQAREILSELLTSCRRLFHARIADMEPYENDVYTAFSRLSTFINSFRKYGMASGEVSRCNQFLSKMVGAFENVKHIYQYRTPRTLRTYSKVFICLLPILYGPYFAEIAKEYSREVTYMMPILFSVILVSLDNIQNHLENPFDQVGEDDVIINVEKFIRRLDL